MSGLIKIFEQEGMLEILSSSPLFYKWGNRPESLQVPYVCSFCLTSNLPTLRPTKKTSPFSLGTSDSKVDPLLPSQESSCCHLVLGILFLARLSHAFSSCNALFSDRRTLVVSHVGGVSRCLEPGPVRLPLVDRKATPSNPWCTLLGGPSD